MYITIALALVLIILGIFTLIMYQRLRALTLGKSAQSLESLIVETNTYVKQLGTKQEQLAQKVQELENDSQYNIQHIGALRFNPFKETGGNQSFAIAFTDKRKSGLVLSSLYTRDRVNVFVKPINEGSSDYLLTKEEQEALQRSYK